MGAAVAGGEAEGWETEAEVRLVSQGRMYVWPKKDPIGILERELLPPYFPIVVICRQNRKVCYQITQLVSKAQKPYNTAPDDKWFLHETQ